MYKAIILTRVIDIPRLDVLVKGTIPDSYLYETLHHVRLSRLGCNVVKA